MSYLKTIIYGSILGFYLGEKDLPFPILYVPPTVLREYRRPEYTRT